MCVKGIDFSYISTVFSIKFWSYCVMVWYFLFCFIIKKKNCHSCSIHTHSWG